LSSGRIVSIESFSNQFVGLVRVSTADGATGWGQMAPYHADMKAIEVGRMLEGLGVSHFEEPCPYWELDMDARGDPGARRRRCRG
jgi:L-alanine-DL-glutamate epimerase-like enolase superfamily enzyme